MKSYREQFGEPEGKSLEHCKSSQGFVFHSFLAKRCHGDRQSIHQSFIFGVFRNSS